MDTRLSKLTAPKKQQKSYVANRLQKSPIPADFVPRCTPNCRAIVPHHSMPRDKESVNAVAEADECYLVYNPQYIGSPANGAARTLRLRIFVLGKRQHAFASPDAHDPYARRLAAVDDTKGREDQLTKERLIELGDYPTPVWVLRQIFDARDDIDYDTLADLGYALAFIPSHQRFQIRDRRLGEANRHSGHLLNRGPA